MEQDIFDLIAELEMLIDTGKKVPFTNQSMVDRDQVMNIVSLIRDTLPEAIQEANRVLKQENRILQDAKKHADNVMAEADAKARTLRMDSEQRAAALDTNSKERADQMIDDAKRKAHDVIESAERKAEELVSQTSITTRAEQQAAEIVTNARAEAQRTRMVTMDHCSEMLKRVEDLSISIANELRDARMQLDQER